MAPEERGLGHRQLERGLGQRHLERELGKGQLEWCRFVAVLGAQQVGGGMVKR